MTRPRQTLHTRLAARAECVELDHFDPRKCRHPEAPRVRAQCEHRRGPCGGLACKFNFGLDVRPTSIPGRTPSIRLVYGTDDPTKWPTTHNCVLQVIDHYAYPNDRRIMLFREIGEHMRMTRQRVQQIYEVAEPKFVAGLIAEGLDAELAREWVEGKQRMVEDPPMTTPRRRPALERRLEELAKRAELLRVARARGARNGGNGVSHHPAAVAAPTLQCAPPRRENVLFF
jgi:hypothetical protein